MDIFIYSDYKDLVNFLIEGRPKEGRGEYKRISDFLGVSSVLISQIFKGPKEISLEQACKLCDYFGFIDLERKYFLNLVNFSRSGTVALRTFYQNELNTIREQSKSIANRVRHKNLLSEEDKAIFYSDWRYSAIRLACDIDRISTTEDLAKYFNLKIEEVKNYTDFLLRVGLIKVESGKFYLGPSSTHTPKDSPFTISHHRNWRLKSINSINKMDTEEIMYSAPMCISQELFSELNQKILKFIDEFVRDATASKSEEVYYLNIDLRKIK